ncbi:hypothetical protein D3H55_09055 [Bacillus salacetis]|uniref:Uncharacterized protein n=1 Tax=Bacillus salacetis TaxID=2315464 RepID=A0A3A1R5N0_9BACI|nr:hypothetical protein D3H55_09055 [Bacillus salacetis]
MGQGDPDCKEIPAMFILFQTVRDCNTIKGNSMNRKIGVFLIMMFGFLIWLFFAVYFSSGASGGLLWK